MLELAIYYWADVYSYWWFLVIEAIINILQLAAVEANLVLFCYCSDVYKNTVMNLFARLRLITYSTDTLDDTQASTCTINCSYLTSLIN